MSKNWVKNHRVLEFHRVEKVRHLFGIISFIGYTSIADNFIIYRDINDKTYGIVKTNGRRQMTRLTINDKEHVSPAGRRYISL
jgi:hypothetical protein